MMKQEQKHAAAAARHNLTFSDVDGRNSGELRLIIVDVDDLDNNLGVAGERRGSLISGGNGQLVVIPNFPVQDYICLNDARILLVNGEGSIMITINNLIIESFILNTVRVHRHHLGHEGPLVVPLPGPGKVDLLGEPGLVVVLVQHVDDAGGVGVQVVTAS